MLSESITARLATRIRSEFELSINYNDNYDVTSTSKNCRCFPGVYGLELEHLLPLTGSVTTWITIH